MIRYVVDAEDSDGDGCADVLEVMDINGDRKVTVADQTLMAKKTCTLKPGLIGCEGDQMCSAEQPGPRPETRYEGKTRSAAMMRVQRESGR